MFESSLVASQQRHVSSEERWTAVASITSQALVAAALVTLPLLHPERLVMRVDVPHAYVPLLKMPKRPVLKTEIAASTSSAVVPRLGASFTAPRRIPTTVQMGADPAPVAFNGVGMPAGIPDALGTAGTGEAVKVNVAPSVRHVERTMRVSSGVSEGLLLTPIRPVYPAIARAAHVSGAVVVEAIISKAGKIESLRVVSGPEMLRGAASDAIAVARYRPHLLKGEATEVQTTITVNFTMGS
jgi:protein TonB